jgi:indole-3-glycerol phosphate synthase
LKTFEIDLSLTEELFPLLPKESLKVAESGIRDQEQLALMRERGADAVLVGTTLMRAPSPGKALERLRAETCG